MSIPTKVPSHMKRGWLYFLSGGLVTTLISNVLEGALHPSYIYLFPLELIGLLCFGALIIEIIANIIGKNKIE